MKKILLSTLLAIAVFGVNAQIYNNPATVSTTVPPLSSPRDVGIGIKSPAGGLHILGGINTGNSGTFLLERKDNTGPSNQNNRLTIGFSSNNFPPPFGLGAGSCAFMLDNPYKVSDMAFSTNRTTPQLLIKQNGNVGINTIPQHKFHVHNGAIMISGTVPGFGGPQLLFSDNLTTHPNGRWAIEYNSADASRPSMGGMNFWQPFPGGGGAGNYSLFLKDDGKIGMGVTDDNTDPNFCANAFPAGYRLYVKGGILTTKLKVAVYCSAQWADYVFDSDYKLKPLDEVEVFTKNNKHLPGLPSANEIVNNGGIDVNEMFAKQMEKIEELTLYIIGMDKEIKNLKKENEALRIIASSLLEK